MKQGDKVWFFAAGEQTIEEDVVQRVTEYESSGVWVATERYAGVPGIDIFPTREALCEHYRKIFE